MERAKILGVIYKGKIITSYKVLRKLVGLAVSRIGGDMGSGSFSSHVVKVANLSGLAVGSGS